MNGNFSYSNPTKLYFGDNALDYLNTELPKYGKHIMLSYGGDSVCDYAKGVSVAAWYDGDPWEKYYLKMEEPKAGDKIIPVGSVLTMVGTGSEMNGGSVITNHAQKLKIGHVFGEEVFPKFAILNPKYTYTLPQRQMVAGIFDIMSHIMEQYFSGSDDNTSDYLAEGLMKSLIHASRIAVKDPQNYEARSNIMWTATWALNTLIGKGKTQDWMVHMIGQSIGAFTDATHGMILSGVSLPYYRFIMKDGLPKFVRFAKNVWDVQGEGKANARPELAAAVPDLSSYDTIILGYPCWWGTMPQAVFTFLESADFAGMKILPFCTHEGSGMGRSESDIKKLCPAADVVKGLAINGSSCNRAEESLKNWLCANGL